MIQPQEVDILQFGPLFSPHPPPKNNKINFINWLINNSLGYAIAKKLHRNWMKNKSLQILEIHTFWHPFVSVYLKPIRDGGNMLTYITISSQHNQIQSIKWLVNNCLNNVQNSYDISDKSHTVLLFNWYKNCLWCPLRYLHKNDVLFVFTSSCL
jgi:hypothetical protein